MNSCVSLAYRKALRPRRGLRITVLAAAPLFALAGCVLLLLFTLIVTAADAQTAPPRQLRIAAAADLQTVLPTLAEQYERATGTHLVISYGSSATLTQQIENGAPQDLFLSADTSFPDRLFATHLTDAAPVLYARGELVLWARKNSPLQPVTLASLQSPRLQHLAIANPAHAPYGRAATAALETMHLTAQLHPKLVIAENIAQTAQFADSGNADAALISLTIASSPHFRNTGSYARLPPASYPEIRQAAVVLQRSENRDAAHHFLIWLLSPAVQNTLPTYGLRSAR